MDNQIIIKYIAVWGWQILSMLFLISSLILFSMPKNLKTSSMYISFFLIFIICEFMVLKRKKEVMQDE